MSDKSLIDITLKRWRSPSNIDLVHYFVQRDLLKNKKSRFTRFKSYDHFFKYLVYWYKYKVTNWSRLYIVVKNKTTSQEFNMSPILRFTDQYQRRIMYKFFHTLDYKLYYWITLTTVAYTGKDWFEYASKMKNDVKYMWSRFYDYQKKYDKNIKYVRVYELTKKNTLHVHIAVFTKLTDNILKRNIVIQNNKFGFVKCMKYTDHKLVGKILKTKDGVKQFDVYRSREWESWYDKGKVTWKYKRMSESSYKLINYVIKYLSKNTSLLHQAIFSFFRIRSYSISKNFKIPAFTRKSSDEFERVRLDWLYSKDLNI